MTIVDQYSKALGITGCDTLIPHVLQAFTRIVASQTRSFAEQVVRILFPGS